MDFKKYIKKKENILKFINNIVSILNQREKREPRKKVDYDEVRTVYMLFYFYIKNNLIDLKSLVENDNSFLDTSIRKFFELLVDFNYIFLDFKSKNTKYNVTLYHLFSQYKKYEIAKIFSIQGVKEKDILEAKNI